MKLVLVASTGGHLAQLMALSDWWSQHQRIWVTFDKPGANDALRDERTIWAHHPTTRHLGNAARNLVLAWRLLKRSRPDLVISTGAGVAVPFFLIARILRIRSIYIEVIDRVASRTLTGRIVYPLADEFCVQWDIQKRLYPDARVIGPTL